MRLIRNLEGVVMLKRIIIASALVVGITSPAWASGCPGISQQVTQKLAKSNMSAAEKAKVVKLQSEGNMLHRTGKHKEAIAMLTRANSMLGM
jgi:hypothetical protein